MLPIYFSVIMKFNWRFTTFNRVNDTNKLSVLLDQFVPKVYQSEILNKISLTISFIKIFDLILLCVFVYEQTDKVTDKLIHRHYTKKTWF